MKENIKGYRDNEFTDIISEEKIKSYLKSGSSERVIRYIYEIDSTNEEAKRNCQMSDGSVFIAEIQNGGKGRRGRKWESEAGSGIWMSILSKPNISPSDISKITLAAGLAVCDSLKMFGLKAMIKWPNDVVVSSKKVCGILTESVIGADGKIYVVTGIGINVNTEKFSDELLQKATSMFLEGGNKFERSEIAASVIVNFEKRYSQFLNGNFACITEDYKKVCLTIGKQVKVIQPTEEFEAYAVGVDSNGELIVEKDGEKITLNSGEVSVRGIYGYV